MIPPADFGIFAIVVILQELALSIPSEGIGSALVQQTARSPTTTCAAAYRSASPSA